MPDGPDELTPQGVVATVGVPQRQRVTLQYPLGAGQIRAGQCLGDQPRGGGRFPVKYYVTAMLFLLFDIEIIFLYPWAVTFTSLGVFGLVEMVLFIATVLVAYAYVWRRGGLNWD